MSFVAFDIRRLDVVEGEVAAFLVTEFGHPPEKVGVDRRVPGLNADKSEPRHLRLLRARRKRPRSSRAAEQSEELATLHSITSSGRASSVGGTASPRALAVFKLITNSSVEGSSIGRRTAPKPPDKRTFSCSLSARRERPRRRRTAEHRDERATPHSITSSARASRAVSADWRHDPRAYLFSYTLDRTSPLPRSSQEARIPGQRQLVQSPPIPRHPEVLRRRRRANCCPRAIQSVEPYQGHYRHTLCAPFPRRQSREWRTRTQCEPGRAFDF